MTTATAATKTKQPGPGLWLSIGVFVLGAALASVGGFLAFTGAFESLTAESFELPGSEVRDFEPGEYDVFASTGSIANFENRSDVSSSDITVTLISTGETLPVRNQNLDLTLNRQTTQYQAVAVFTVVEAGTYEINIASNEADRAVVARSILDSWERVRIPLVIAGVGTVIAVLGAIMVVAGIIRRSRASKAQQSHAAMSATWQAQPAPGPAPGFANTTAPNPTAPSPSASPAPPPAPGVAPDPRPNTPPPPPPGGTGSQTDSDTPWG